jgi:hypothetical protein
MVVMRGATIATVPLIGIQGSDEKVLSAALATAREPAVSGAGEERLSMPRSCVFGEYAPVTAGQQPGGTIADQGRPGNVEALRSLAIRSSGMVGTDQQGVR